MHFENSKYIELLEFSKGETLLALIEEGIDVNFIGVIIDRLNIAVSGQYSLEDLIQELDQLIQGTTAITSNKRITKGLLERYTSQVTTDALNQYTATYTDLLSQDLKFQFYYYFGTKVKDTREFCLKYANKYYHRKEIEGLGLKSPEDPFTHKKLITLNPDLLNGRIPNTNPSNIFTRRGGYRCGHQWNPVSVRNVPKSTLIRNLENGNWKPSEKILSELNI